MRRDMRMADGDQNCAINFSVSDDRFGSIATGSNRRQVQRCPLCPVSDGRPEKRDLR
jgi:hypothetical protein